MGRFLPKKRMRYSGGRGKRVPGRRWIPSFGECKASRRILVVEEVRRLRCAIRRLLPFTRFHELAIKGVESVPAGFLLTLEINVEKCNKAKALLRSCTLRILRYGDA